MTGTIKSPWEPARVNSAEAYYIGGHLVLVVSGDKPTPCYEVRIDNSLDVEPPTFLVQWRQTGGLCPAVVTPYRKVGIFFIGSYREKVNVVSAEGTKSIAVKKLPLAREGAVAEAAKKAGITARTATGYSAAFSFEEAFRNAIAQLPPLYPDELQHFVVTETGAFAGSIAGIQELYVTVTTN
ncbi:MAG TPA: hypothetical protein VF432_03635 [Thermoanaerobaculia bacterium]